MKIHGIEASFDIDPLRVLKQRSQSKARLRLVASLDIDPLRVLKLIVSGDSRLADLCFTLHRPAEGIETSNGGKRSNNYAKASLYIDPLRVLKHQAGDDGSISGEASLYIDPLRVLKLIGECVIVGIVGASLYIDPLRVLKQRSRHDNLNVKSALHSTSTRQGY